MDMCLLFHTHTHTLIKTHAHLSTKCCKLPERQPLSLLSVVVINIFFSTAVVTWCWLNNVVTQFILNVDEHKY